MRAVVLNAFGGPEELRPAEVPDPEPGPGELLVRVRATSANPFDVQQRRGDYREAMTLPAIIGSDVSGVVEATGPGCRDFRPGDEVYALLPAFTGAGSYAQLACVAETLAARKPANVTHEEAATLPVAAGTAWECLVRRGNLRVGETALIHAAAGGVGSHAVQIAKAAGARVLATCSGGSIEFVRSLGADRAIDYTREDVVAAVLAEGGADLVLDTIGGNAIERAGLLLRPSGRVVTIVDIPAPQNLLPLWERNASIQFVFTPPSRGLLDDLRAVVESGQVRPLLESVLPLSRVAEAHGRLERGGVRGKIGLDPSA
ncbi:MAG: zinc-binding dehydrogenase [Thermoleophilia bacterium]|nr:zinc-binding dehydrogenase [Thermoleophilia bacterium]